MAGKAIQSIVRGPNGLWRCRFVGHHYELSEGSELAELERLIADHGFYSYRAEPGELEAMEAGGTLDGLFLRLMRERLAEWLDFADTRLRPQGVPLYLMLGNDDPPELAEMLDQAPWGIHAERPPSGQAQEPDPQPRQRLLGRRAPRGADQPAQGPGRRPAGSRLAAGQLPATPEQAWIGKNRGRPEGGSAREVERVQRCPGRRVPCGQRGQVPFFLD